MPNVIYHVFNENELDNKKYPNSKGRNSCAKIFTHIGKSGEKFVCMKFDAVLKIKNKPKKNPLQEKHKSSFELFQEIMEKINEE